MPGPGGRDMRAFYDFTVDGFSSRTPNEGCKHTARKSHVQSSAAAIKCPPLICMWPSERMHRAPGASCAPQWELGVELSAVGAAPRAGS